MPTDRHPTTENELPETARVGRVALLVADLEETVAFYRDVVGLAVLARDEATATLGAGDNPLLELRASDAPPRPDDAAGLYHLAVRFPSQAALADALARVRDRERWRLSGASDHRVSEALYLSDPEGNSVELYRDRPRDAWPVTDDGRVRMETLPLDLADLADLAAARGGDAAAPAGTDVGHVHLEVTSIPDARAFYVDALGTRVRQEYGSSALFVAAGDYHHHVGLNTWNRRTAPAPHDGRGLSWFEVVVPDRPALAAARERFERRDVPVTSLSEDAFEVTDPDGIALRLRTP